MPEENLAANNVTAAEETIIEKPENAKGNERGDVTNDHTLLLNTSEPPDNSSSIPDDKREISDATDATALARIVARRARIEAVRLAKTKTATVDEPASRKKIKVEPGKREAGKSKAQVIESKRRIDSKKASGSEQVSSVRVTAVARESQRRLEDNCNSEKWEEKRKQEQVESAILSKKINAEWEKTLKITGPYELHGLLTRQKEACDSLISVKNKLVNEYIGELKNKDDEYVKELKGQSEEIDSILGKMEIQYRTLRSSMWDEIQQIERAYIEERSETIESNSKELETRFSNRRENESKFMEERAGRIENFIYQLEQLRIHDAEEYNLVKIKLETDVKVLEQQLQQMRATYQLNIEKLEYNYQILKKREEENGTILSSQKRKITRLTDHLNTLKGKISKQEKSFQQEYLTLTDDYKRMTEQYQELQKKFRHFQIADSTKYREIWNMNEEIAKERMRKVLQADRIIHEQQLGLAWTPPDDDLFATIESTEYPTNQKPDDSEKNEKEVGIAAMMVAALNAESDDEEEEQGVGGDEPKKTHPKKIKRMLELLCNEAGFLVEERLQKLLATLQKDEQSLMKLDSIFKALGVETMEDIEKLITYFQPPSNSQEDNKLADRGSQFINPNDVIRAVKSYVADSMTEKQNKEAAALLEKSSSIDSMEGDNPPDVGAAVSTEPTQAVELHASCKLAKESPKSIKRKEYWERMTKVIENKNYRTWNAVYSGMEKYHQVLSERWQLTQEIESIDRQNNELRQLLRQYMSAPVNDDLQIPPTQIMLAQAGIYS